MESDEETSEENEIDLSESDNTRDALELLENVDIQDEKYGTLEDVFFHLLPPLHPHSCYKILVYLPVNTPLYFKGKLKIVRVISGALECLGNVMTRRCNSGYGKNVFSPKGYSLLSLLAVLENKKEVINESDLNMKLNKEVKSEIKNLNLEKEIYHEIVQKVKGQGCLFELAKLDGPGWVKTLETCLIHSSSDSVNIGDPRKGRQNTISLFGRDFSFVGSQTTRQVGIKDSVEELLNVSFYDSYPKEGQRLPRLFKSSPDWDTAIQSILNVKKCSEENNPRLVVAGGKGVGKSTFMRFMANRLLNQVEPGKYADKANVSSILFIDLDPGQAEFTIPGCISATKMVSSVMGPNFSHLDQMQVLEYESFVGTY